MYVNYLILTFLCNVLHVWCYTNTTANFTDNNNLWLTVVRNCEDQPSPECLKNSIHDYLKDTLDYPGEVEFTDFMKFTRNGINYENLNKVTDISNDINNKTITQGIVDDESPLEEISRSLKDDTRKFLMTHDLQVQLPETFFLGSALKISPRSIDSTGLEVKFEVIPKILSNTDGEGRTIKIIKNFITERLAWALLAILLVIKLLAVKVLFILPTILGVAAAKKLILKVLLFLFPFLHHLFKLCAYTPYGAKHHIHKHQISHIHEIAHGHTKPYHHYPHGGVEVISSHADGPPHYISKVGKKGDFDPYGEPNPGLASAYADEILHRNDAVDEENEIDPWGQGQPTRRPKPTSSGRPLTPTEIENMVLKAEKEALIKSRLQKERQRIQDENLRLQAQLNNALRIQEKLKQQAASTNKISSNLSFKPPHTNSALLPTLSPPPVNYMSAPVPNQIIPPTSLQVHPHISPHFNHQIPKSSQNFQPSQMVPQLPSQYSPRISQQLQPQSPNHLPSQFSSRVDMQVSNSFPGGQIVGTSTKVEPSRTAQIAVDFIKQKEVSNGYQTQTPQNSNFAGSIFKAELNPNVQIVKASEIQDTQYSTKSKKPDMHEKIYKAASITYDPFYSPILEKIDKILNELDFTEEPCRERMICSMYKNPTKFSPHSNLLSAELSRDSKELQKPKTTNAAVVRFYRYVQAARDGQDQRDCLRLYPACVINTEA